MKHVADRASFMKLMIRDYADQLELPPAFVKRMGRRVNGKFVKSMWVCNDREYMIKVWGSAGSHCWIVEAEKDGDGLFFRKGWPEFVKENNVRFADVLVFFQGERTKFLVKIFDPTGLKRNMVTAMIPTSEDVAVEALDEEDGEGDNEPRNRDLKEENGEDDDLSMSKDLDEANGEGDDGPMNMIPNDGNGDDQPMSMDHDDANEEGNDDLRGGQVKQKKRKIEPTWVEGSHHCEIEGKKEKEEDYCDEPTQEKSFNLLAMTGKREQGSVGPYKKENLCQFEEEKQSVKESSALPPFCSSNTNFVANWSPTWQHYLTIPKEIAIEKDLHSKTQLLFRDVNGKIWFMKLSQQEDDTMNTSEDWFKFCKCFGLKEGDSCTFEFTSSRIVHVHISATRSNSLPGQ